MKPRLFVWLVAAILMVGLAVSPVLAQTGAAKTDAPKAAKQAKKAEAAPAVKAEKPAAKPAAKKAAVEAQKPPQPGMVWANEKSKVYHKEGDQWYGKSKNCKWMTEDEAKKAGYKEAGAGAAKPAAKKAAKK